MDGAFSGFALEVFEWFAGLERDNSKAYFTATRDRYETEVRGGLQGMLDELSATFGGEVKLFRQQRDLRFAPKGWVELLIRSAGIYVCVLFFPIVLVARIWPKLERWATRLAEALTALILSKFVIVAVLSVAGAAMAGSRASEGFNGVLAAGALLVFAAFAPLVLFRLVQFADPQVHSRAGSAGTVARTGQTTMGAAQAARMSMDRQSSGGGLPTAAAAEMARGSAASWGGTLPGQGSGEAGRGPAGGTSGQPNRSGGAASGVARATTGGPATQTAGASGGRAATPGDGASTPGARSTTDSAGGQREFRATDADPAERQAAVSDRRPVDPGPPRPRHPDRGEERE